MRRRLLGLLTMSVSSSSLNQEIVAMCTAFAVLGTILIAKMAFRMAHFRRHGYAGGCGGWHRLHHHPGFGGSFRGGPRGRFRSRGPIDLGDLDDVESMQARTPDVAVKIDEILRSLDLNARQAAEAGDVLATVRAAVGPDHYASGKGIILALRASAKLPFDDDLAEAAIGDRVAPAAAKEAVDALEHLHNILTDEQRTTLEKLTARS